MAGPEKGRGQAIKAPFLSQYSLSFEVNPQSRNAGEKLVLNSIQGKHHEAMGKFCSS